jgi:hypothetical protein
LVKKKYVGYWWGWAGLYQGGLVVAKGKYFSTLKRTFVVSTVIYLRAVDDEELGFQIFSPDN